MSQEVMANGSSEKGRSLIIRGLVPGLTERGKIKIGEKGRMVTSAKGKEFQPPKKLDHFRITTLNRGPDDNYVLDREVHDKHGAQPRTVPVRLLYDEIDLNFQCRYVCFVGKKMWCTGDGEAAWRLTGENGKRAMVDCPCGRQEPEYQGTDKCKINGCLSVIIDGIDRVGGVWKFRTTSYNSVVGILSSLSLIKRITGGPLAGIPLNLTLNPKTAIVPTTGQAMNIWVVGLEYLGSMQSLQDIGYKQSLAGAVHYQRITHIEEEARKLLSHNPVTMDDEDPSEIVDEYYPDQAKKAMTTTSTVETQDGPITVEHTNGHATPVIPAGETATTPPENTGQQNGTPEPAPENQPSVSETKRARRRANRFPVNPAEWAGKDVLLTCGATPDQIALLRRASTDAASKIIIKSALVDIGYDELSYFTKEEAEAVIVACQQARIVEGQPGGDGDGDVIDVSPGAPEEQAPPESVPAEAPNDMIECAVMGGDRMSISGYCKSGDCRHRAQDGWCPLIGEDAPAGEEVLI